MACSGCKSNFGHDEGCPNALDHLKVQAVLGSSQYTMKRDYFQLALLEWKKANPLMKREGDVDREWVLKRAQQMRGEGGAR